MGTRGTSLFILSFSSNILHSSLIDGNYCLLLTVGLSMKKMISNKHQQPTMQFSCPVSDHSSQLNATLAYIRAMEPAQSSVGMRSDETVLTTYKWCFDVFLSRRVHIKMTGCNHPTTYAYCSPAT
jgi:hypothetical protein